MGKKLRDGTDGKGASMDREISMDKVISIDKAASKDKVQSVDKEISMKETEEGEADRERAAEAYESAQERKVREAETSESDRVKKARKAEASESDRKRAKKKKNRCLTGSMGAKVVSFFLLGISGFLGIAAIAVCLYMGMAEYYTSSLDNVLMKELRSMMNAVADEAADYLAVGDVDAAEKVCEGRNVDLELYYFDDLQDRQVVWSTWSGYDTKLISDVRFILDSKSKGIVIGRHSLRIGKAYWLQIYVNPEFPQEDKLQRLAALVTWGYESRYLLIGAAVGCVFLSVACFVFLLCAAGRRNGREGIVSGVLTAIPLDMLTAVYGIGLFMLCRVASDLIQRLYYHWYAVVGIAAAGVTIMVISAFYFMDFALRFKRGKWWRHSLIFFVLYILWKAGRLVWRGIAFLFKKGPAVVMTLAFFLGTCILEFIALLLFNRSTELVLLWSLEKFILLFVVMYIALICKELLKASRALAEGQENYQVDTSRMFGNFKEHGENLNSLGQGISIAVAGRMKSEHLKTELITNVSHDIKTPLTSITNYADLIWEETVAWEKDHEEAQGILHSENGQGIGGETDPGRGGDFPVRGQRIKEYAEVLLRQSRRMKKLLEDLLEASKATTGNLEVNLVPCEAGVLLSQAVGEYQQRMAEKGLELIARQPEQPVMVMADGRHLWRVFDNLLNNICKYAQENTRVYLTVDEKGETVQIIFRNMSKYFLDISGDELEERFVRGDKSRHMEGNGLGLSIAKSLIGLQNGKMEIVIDGDLFKVVLSFAAYRGEQHPEES